jgi:hypothetical protein
MHQWWLVRTELGILMGTGIYFVDRQKYMIISGRISIAEVEMFTSMPEI